MHRPRSALAAALAVLALAGCATATREVPQAQGDGPVTMRFQSLAYQEPTIEATKAIVQRWNEQNPDAKVEYVQGSWDSVQDQLVTQFQGGTAPDVIQYESSAMTQFARQGYLEDLGDAFSPEVRSAVPDDVWRTVTVDGELIAAPTLLQSYVVFANRDLLEAAGVEVPTGSTWSWDDFEAAARATTRDGVVGVGWGLNEPTATMLSLGLNYDGDYVSGSGDEARIQVGRRELEVPERIRGMVEDGTVDKVSLSQSGTDVMPGFLRGRYAMTVQGSFQAQELAASAPEGLDWVALPPLEGTSADQAANPQTLSVSAQSPYREQAAEFVDYYMRPENLAAVAQGDWLIPTSKGASDVVREQTAGRNGWPTILATGDVLTAAPIQSAADYPRWKDQIATPAFQRYLGGETSAGELARQLTEGWTSAGAR